ncbi:MAG TPA: hypothetical protein VG838_15100 [Opitutaceae bacterium]|nr:hypothetical protein [Opitutaceae bacterium]
MKNVDLTPYWNQVHRLFAEQHFLTIVCGFVVVLMVLSFYRFLKSVSPMLVPVFLLLVIFILFMHWTQTRTEPAALKPAVDWFLRVVPLPTVGAPAPAQRH